MKYALITGASKGIGRAMAIEISRLKMGVLLVARSENILDTFSKELIQEYGIDVQYLSIDLSLDSSAQQVYQWCVDEGFNVSFLINNAGYGMWGYFDKLKIKEQLNMMQLNTTCLVELTYLMIPILRKNETSYILNVASTAAYQPVPAMSVYAATKSFVITFSQSLEYELRDRSISVSFISPGSTDTGFMDRANMNALKKIAEKFNMSPQKVAKIAIKETLNKKREIIPGHLNYFSSKISNMLPAWLSAKLAANIYIKNLKA